MDGAVQTVYPRKNWSSLMLFNCDHPAVRSLTPDVVNRESGAYLHRMQWVADEDIGALPVEWNWLEGWNEKPAQGTPKVVHFTRGGPWFEQLAERRLRRALVRGARRDDAPRDGVTRCSRSRQRGGRSFARRGRIVSNGRRSPARRLELARSALSRSIRRMRAPTCSLAWRCKRRPPRRGVGQSGPRYRTWRRRADAYGAARDALVALGRLAEAVESFDRALALDPRLGRGLVQPRGRAASTSGAIR